MEIRKLLAPVFLAGLFLDLHPAVAQSNGVLREVYLNLNAGGAVADLTNASKFPNNPDIEEVLTTSFEAPVDVTGDHYGQRVRALLVPPVTGSYTFYIASDDASVLYLSTDESPANKVQIARVATWTASRVWQESRDNNAIGQKSVPRTLTAGTRYYVEALMKEGEGGDNLAVTWQKPGDPAPVNSVTPPIPAANLVPYGLGPPVISGQPAHVTISEGGSATFSVQLARKLGATYQWVRNGTSIIGANASSYALGPVTLSDSASTFYCAITNSFGGTNSATVTLTVNPDTTRPTLLSALNLGDNQIVTVAFSEPLEPASANLASNYALNNGATVQSASLSDDGSTVVLITSPLAFTPSYTLTVNNVRDRAQAPNAILSNSQRTFVLTYAPLDVSYVTGALEPIGPSSRRTGLVISEIMYHPSDRADGRNLEFVELYNANPWAEDLSNHRLAGEVDYAFPPGTTIGPLSYRVVAAQPADLQAVYGLTGVWGPMAKDSNPANTTNVLDNGGGTIRLRDELGSVLLEAVYDDEPPYPPAADGAGHSLQLVRPTYGERQARAWAASDRVGGTPGTNESVAPNPFRTVLINEFLAHTDDPQLDFVELFNYHTNPVNVAGCILTDDPATNKFVIPAGTSIPARGFVSFTQSQLGFALENSGETLYFKNTNATKILDAVRFGDQENGIATGRYPDGAPTFHRLVSPTPGTNNARLLISNIVINEIMYNPVSHHDADEFVELYNRGTNAVDIGKWRLRGGVSYTFPSGTILGPNSYWVVASDMANLIALHPGLSPANTLGNYSGQLGNGGDTLVLDKPDDVVTTNGPGQLVTNKIHIVVDEVTYGTGGRWGKWSDGEGSSLELIDARSDSRLAPNWADSDESNRSAWTTVEFTGLLDHGAMASADQLHVLLLGAGECLVDNVEVIPQGGGNVVQNSTFDSGANGWFFQGTHDLSYWQATGGFSGGCLHVVATDRGDPGANRLRATLTQTLGAGSTATLRAKVRWLKGNPEILLRLHGNYLEAPGRIVTTRALGTPGARNSQARTNTGPAITDVSHAPILPAANQAVLVTARVHDPDGLSSLSLNYRVDPATNFTRLAMSYNGAGFYSASLPGQPNGTRIAFHLEAQDNSSTRATTFFPSDAPGRECLVGFGESVPSGSLGAYRLWVTQRNVQRWTSREKNSNEPLDASFAYGNSRVVYNVGALYSGSPWHTPGYSGPNAGACDYEVNFPKDDVMLGAEDFVLATVGNLGSDSSLQAEQTAFWIGRKIGAPYLYRRYVRVFFNGQQRQSVYEDSQQPSADVVAQFFPDDKDGHLHKIEDWFEFDDSGDGKLGNVDATLQNFTTSGGVKKMARYRWIFRPRAVTESAHDFTNLFALVDAMNATPPEPYRTQVEALVDVNGYMRILAAERIAGNWDSWGYSRGKNMYTYKPQKSGWVLFPWDIDFVLGSGSNASNDGLFGGNEPVLNNFRAFPTFLRAYWRAFEDAVSGPMSPANLNTLLDSKYNALVAQGTGAGSPQFIKDYVSQRRTYIQSQLTNVAAVFRIDGPASFSTNRNLITLTGTAPIKVETITINGIAFRVTWNSVSNWSVRIALDNGTSSLVFGGLDNKGRVISGVSGTRNITYTGSNELPQDKVVINEIMYHPAVPEASFVELLNTSASNAFDLSRWRIEGIDCDIPDGTLLEPGQFLVFVKDKAVFAAAYGSSIPVAGLFDGSLDLGGETLKLIKPGATSAQDILIDQVTYDDDPPWPGAADGSGPSLQLIDALQDNNRVANWATAAAGPLPTNAPQTLLVYSSAWKYMQGSNLDGINWTAPTYNDSAWPSGPGLLAYETAALPEPIRTTLTTNNSRITFYFRTHFNYTGSLSGVSLKLSAVLDDGAVFYLNGQEIYRLGMDAGPVTYSTVANRTVADANYEGPFNLPATALLPGDNVVAVEVHQINTTSSDIVFGLKLETDFSGGGSGLGLYTPRSPNSVRATRPPFPLLWLNEVLPNNVAGITNAIADRFGDRDPWVELYNGGTNAINLSGFYLGTNYTSPLQWPFPPNSVIEPGQFLVVWLDGEPAESINTELHASFRIAPEVGAVTLSKTNAGEVTLIDYLNYTLPSVGRSYGDYADGNVSGRQIFSITTPGATNNPTGAPITVFINEWMADNLGTLADPVDDQFEDWFEIYNPGSDAVDLSGYYLTDALTNKTKWQIPSGTVVPGQSYLLFWADDETSQNEPGGEPHTNFKLRASGQEIGLFASGGAMIDAIIFGQQTNDVSQGRFADGQASIYFMTTPTPGTGNYIDIAQTNAPPVLMPIGNKIVDEGVLLTFAALATDPNSPPQTLSFSLDAGAPMNASIHPSSGVFSWIPTEAQGAGLYSITARVTDNGAPPLNDAKTFTVQVNEVNNAPLLAIIGDRTITEGVALSVTNQATDPDSPAQMLTFALDSGAPSGMTLTSDGVLQWTPDESQGPGSYAITVRVTDNGEPPLSGTQPLTVTVNEANTAPVLAAIPNSTNTPGKLITFIAQASDADLPTNGLTFSLDAGAPASAVIGAHDGVFSWTPALDQTPSTNVFTVRVTDNGVPALSDSHTVTIVVAASLSMTRITEAGGVVTLEWTAAPGQIYQVQYKTSLNEVNWTDLGGRITATDLTATTTDNLAGATQRFYRVVLNP